MPKYYFDEADDKEKSFEYAMTGAKLGNAEAMNRVGNKYERGNGVKKDTEKAVEWYTKSAETGETWAQNKLGLGNMYDNGEGVPQDRAKAIEWFTKATEAGDDDARQELAKLTSEQAAASGESAANAAEESFAPIREDAQPEEFSIPEATPAPEPESKKSHLAGKIIGALVAAGIVALAVLRLTGVIDVTEWLSGLLGLSR